MRKEKKKILYVITKGNWGGAQRYVYDLASGLDKELYEPMVILGQEGILSRRLSEIGIRVIPLPSLSRNIHIFKDAVTFFSLINIFLRERPEVIHLNSSKAGILGVCAGRIVFSKNIIFTSHGWAFNEDRNIITRFIFKLFSWVTVLLSHSTIAVSDSVCNQICTMPFVFKKIITIKNGIGDIELKNREDARKILLRERLPSIPQNALWVGTIGELHLNKGTSYAIEAIKNINIPIVFVVVGEGEEKWALQNIVENNGLEEKVYIIGFREHASSLLHAFDIFTLTSTTEALGYVLLEAGIAKLPVIASDVGGIPEIIENKKTGLLIQPRNKIQIEEGIEFLSHHKEIRESFGEELFKKIKKEFSLTSMREKTFTLYQ